MQFKRNWKKINVLQIIWARASHQHLHGYTAEVRRQATSPYTVTPQKSVGTPPAPTRLHRKSQEAPHLHLHGYTAEVRRLPTSAYTVTPQKSGGTPPAPTRLQRRSQEAPHQNLHGYTAKVRRQQVRKWPNEPNSNIERGVHFSGEM